VPFVERDAASADADAIARIYNEGIEDRVATFEVRPRTGDDVRGWLGGDHPVVVIEDAGEVVAWAAASAYSARACYAGVAEVSVYVARAARGRGLGRTALDALAARAARAGFHKLTGKILAENAASRALVRAAGFREVGVHERHALLDGTWRDVVVVERLLGR
jgi:L-amino acid N-acyltransferase YncA